MSVPPPRKIVTWSRRVQRWFIAGLVLLAPSVLTFWALFKIVDLVDKPVRNAVLSLTGLKLPGIGLGFTLLIIIVTGAIVSTFAVKGTIAWFEGLLDRIPLVRTLYSAVKQLLAPFGEEKSTPFRQVVMVEFPNDGSYSLGFLIKPDVAISPDGHSLSAVLVPTNHLHLGNVVLYESKRIHSVDMSAEEGLKFLVSMGIALEHKLALGARPIHELTKG